jgi:hypothetical protein
MRRNIEEFVVYFWQLSGVVFIFLMVARLIGEILQLN